MNPLPYGNTGNYVHQLNPSDPSIQPNLPTVRILNNNRQSDSRNRRQSDSRKRKFHNVDVPTVWNDLQIEQWPEDDNLRKTRVQIDQFWDHLNDNVDDYVQRKASLVAGMTHGEFPMSDPANVQLENAQEYPQSKM